jgi:hypothetical protein
MTTALTKIATALDLLADDLDAQPAPAAAPAATPETKTASSVDLMRELYRQRTGEDLPATVRDKLAAADDPEMQTVLGKMLKTAAPERPTPLGAPSETRAAGAAPESGDEATKLAWEAFEDTILNGPDTD